MRRSLLPDLLLLLGLMSALCCQAQSSFRYKSDLEKAKTSAFYKVILTPSIVSKCSDALTDIRLLNEKGEQVPYILQSDENEFSEASFIELPIVSIKKESDKQTHVVIQNQLNKTLNEILLVIKNTEADRYVNISGSDDNKQWFIIRENVRLGNFIPPDNSDRFIQSISFPSSSYKFFKIIINGKDLLPVNIVKAGVYQGAYHQSKYQEIPSPFLKQKDSSNNVSYVSVHFDSDYLINKIEITIEGTKYFRRNLRIGKLVDNKAAWQESYTLSSASPASYSVNVKAKALSLEIDNQDNPPLKVRAVKAYQLGKSLLVHLDPGINYHLAFGNSATKAPSYDLQFFKDSITNTATEIGIGAIVENKLAKTLNKETDKQGTVILWVIMGAVLVLLLALTIQMTKEMKRKENG